MPFGIANFEQLPWYIQVAMEDAEVQIQAWLTNKPNAPGTRPGHEGLAGLAGAVNALNGDGRWWRGAAPWLLDDPNSDTPDVVGIRLPAIPAGTYHNYAPPGIDTCVMLDVSPTGNVTFTGIKIADTKQKRLMAIRHQGTTSNITITLAHANTGSLGPYRFDLPNAVDVVLAPRQIAWMIYEPDRQAIALFITPQQSGGMGSGISGPTSAVSGNLAVFDGVTGQILKDGGAGSGVQIVSASFTTAQIDALNATPITLVAAPGANKMIIGVSLGVQTKRSGVWSNSGTNWLIRYIGVSPATTMFSVLSSFLTAAGANTHEVRSVATGPTLSNNSTSNYLNNVGVELSMTGDANPGIQTGSFDLTLAYYVVPLTA